MSKNKAKKYLLALKEQRNISIRVVQKVLTHESLKSGKSFDDLIEYYSQVGDKKSEPIIKKAGLVLEKLYNNNMIYGNRVCYFYTLQSKKQYEHVEQIFKQIFASDENNPETDLFRENYPFNIEQSHLDDLELGKNYFVKCIDDKDCIRLFSSSARAYKDSINIEPDALGDDYLEYYEIVGYKKIRRQPFDSIIFHKKKGVVEIQIDMAYPVTKDDRKMFVADYYNLLKKTYREKYKKELLLVPYNIFNKIDSLYEEIEGSIVALEHKTGTNSVKKERMSSKKEDLKEEDFHSSGLNAISRQTNFYSITKEYDSPIFGEKNLIELVIAGGVKLISLPHPMINDAEINNCIYQEEYDYLINKLI
jgi:hypothetical protein